MQELSSKKMKSQDIKPTRGDGKRDLNCRNYDECLSKIIEKNWPNFNCTECPSATSDFIMECAQEEMNQDYSDETEKQLEKELERLRKLYQRARDTSHLEPKKQAYTWRASGCTDFPGQIFKKSDLKALCSLLGHRATKGLSQKIQSAGQAYVAFKGIFMEKPDFSKSNQIIHGLMKGLEKAIEGLELLEGEPLLYQSLRMRTNYTDLNSIRRLYYAAEEFHTNVVMGNKQLANLPMMVALEELAGIYEEATGLKLTGSGRRPKKIALNKGEDSDFLLFAHKFFSFIDSNLDT